MICKAVFGHTYQTLRESDGKGSHGMKQVLAGFVSNATIVMGKDV